MLKFTTTRSIFVAEKYTKMCLWLGICPSHHWGSLQRPRRS